MDDMEINVNGARLKMRKCIDCGFLKQTDKFVLKSICNDCFAAQLSTIIDEVNEMPEANQPNTS